MYSKAIINVLGDETDFIECSEGQAIIKLEAYFDDDESTDKLCIITDESSVSLLERISEVGQFSLHALSLIIYVCITAVV